MSSNDGALLLGQVERRLRELLAQRVVYGIALGYEDLDDPRAPQRGRIHAACS
jgi:hypothetical protein